MREFLFLKDNQLYYDTPILFKSDATHEQLVAINAAVPSNGRISVEFGEFRALVLKYGFVCDQVKVFPDTNKSPAPTEYPTIRGAQGNY